MNKTILLSLLAWCSICTARAEIPVDLVGVWATQESVLNDELLFEGTGLYLGNDGVGVLIGGPPPIGVKIYASYDSVKKTISYKMVEGGKGVLNYNETHKTISFKGRENNPLTRRFAFFSNSTKKALGFE